MITLKKLVSISIISLLLLPTFTFAEESHIENTAEEINNITLDEDLTNDNTIIFPKAKINVNDVKYEKRFESLHAGEGFIFAKVNMDVWIEEEPSNKVNWSANDFVNNKWVLNDGREIIGGSLTTGSSTLVEAGKWKNVTVALSIRDFQKIYSIYVVDPLNRENKVKVQIGELDSENPENNEPIGEDLTNDNTIILPKAKINVNDVKYEKSFESLRASEGFIFAKVNMDVWIEEEPSNKVNWSANDFVNKWVLNDGREIIGASTTGSSRLVEAGKWKNVTVALSIRDFQKIYSIYVVDPLNRENKVKVQIGELDSENPENNEPIGEDLTNDNTIILPKAKINVNDVKYEKSFESLRASEGFIFAKVNMDVWIEEEPSNKVNWSANDFVNKWVLNDGREIIGASTTGSSRLVEAGKWKNVTVALSIRDFQKIYSIYVVDPLNRENKVKVQIGELDADKQIVLKAFTQNNSIKLTWDHQLEADYYQIFRSEDEQKTFYPLATIPITDTLYIDTDVQPNNTYWYKISATKDNADFLHSNVIKAILQKRNDAGSTDSGGGSNINQTNPKDISASNGGFIESLGARVEIPANALTSNFKITISKVTNTSNLTTDEYTKIVSDIYEIIKDRIGNFDKSVKITLPFDKSKYDTKSFDISIFYFNEETRKWIELDNIEVDLNSGKVSGEVNHFTKFAVLATEFVEQTQESVQFIEFIDITDHWAESYIKRASARGIVGGYPDGAFKPNASITRAEFTVMLVNSLNLEGDATPSKFSDDKQIGAWAKQAIDHAVQAGIIAGYDDGSFRPSASITRTEMAVMFARAMYLQFDTNVVTQFADEKDIPEWGKGAIDAVHRIGIVNGRSENRFVPNGIATRAEATAMLIRMLERKENQ